MRSLVACDQFPLTGRVTKGAGTYTTMADLAGECFEQAATTYRLRAISSRVAREPRAGQYDAAAIASAIARQKGSIALAIAGLKALRSPSRSLSKRRISNSPDGREN
jgi:hypothetical protein